MGITGGQRKSSVGFLLMGPGRTAKFGPRRAAKFALFCGV